MSDTIASGMVGTIAYKLYVDGSLYEEVGADDEMDFLYGADNLVPGLEAGLTGKKAGDTFDITVKPADGFGEYDDTLIEEIPLDDLVGMDDIQVGMDVELMDDEGDMFEATVIAIEGDTVRLDFNDPFASKTLRYVGEVVKVRPATDEEVDMGLPESLAEEIHDDLADDDNHRH
jgi:FKBP-type peptidyl-prolyl cis-trans isomerase SlyD